MTAQLTTSAAAILRAIIAEPDEDHLRLLFADCIEENGDEERAEFVRVQVELARIPTRRELVILDGAGKPMDGLAVGLIPEGDGHYSASYQESGLSVTTFAPNERVDIYAETPKKGIRWMRGLRYVKHVEERQIIIFRKDAQSLPCPGAPLRARESTLLAPVHDGLTNRERWAGIGRCAECDGNGSVDVYRGEPSQGIDHLPCGECRSTGRTGAMATRINTVGPPDPVTGATNASSLPRSFTYRRGFPYSVEVTLDEIGGMVTAHAHDGGMFVSGSGEQRFVPSDFARSLIRDCPTLEMMPVVGKKSSQARNYGDRREPPQPSYDWEMDVDAPHGLPGWLFGRMLKGREDQLHRDEGDSWLEFATAQEALDVLARTVCGMVREGRE